MLPRSDAPWRRAANNYPPPPVTLCFEYNHQRPTGVNRFPVYEWNHTPSASPVLPPPRPLMSNWRKRPSDAYSPHVVKRQCLESPPPVIPPLIQTPPPRHDQAVAGSSRPSFSINHRYPSPQSLPRHQVPAAPESSKSLQAYAEGKVSGQMVELFETCQQQSSDLDWKEMCRTQLQNVIQRVFPNARLYLTGSSMNGLGCRSSDADLCLVMKGNRKPDPIHVLSVLQRTLTTVSYLQRVQLIRAKVPILKFKEKDRDLEFDLNVNNTLGIRNTFLLKAYAHADLRIRPMIVVVKKWARHNQINDASKGTLSSYTLVLMVLHYLQTLKEPVLPCLQKDYPECFSLSMTIDKVPKGPEHIPPFISRNQSSLGDLLLGFLKYYATDFRWNDQVISVREARALPKDGSGEWRNKFICVEEPFERNNVARAVHEKIKFDAIRAQFVESYQTLRERKDLNSILPVRDIVKQETSRK